MSAYTKKHVFSVGELFENEPWSINQNHLVKDHDSPPCPHAIYDSSAHEEGYANYRVPFVIECRNEGGNNSTVLCLDCLFAAAETVLP